VVGSISIISDKMCFIVKKPRARICISAHAYSVYLDKYVKLISRENVY